MSATGGMMLSFQMPALAKQRPWEQRGTGAEIGAWLTIDPDNTITIRVAQSEMGQGVMTALPMIVAEELEADWRLVKAEYADVHRQLTESRVYGRMKTSGSTAVQHSRPYLQQAGAEARERLIKAAAEKWRVSPEDCYADYGRIYRNGSSDSVTYGEVAALAAQVSVANVRIKTPDEFNSLGLPQPRLDVPAKVDGSAIFSMDVRPEGMVYAAVKHCPLIGGRVKSMRYNAVRNMPGVIRFVRESSWVAIVADTYWHAQKAADALPIFWEEGEAQKTFSNTFKQDFFEKLSGEGEHLLSRQGDIVQLMDYSERTIESDYYVPYLAHVPMEPLNCTVHVQNDRIDVWVGHQDPELAVEVVAEVSGRPLDTVYLHNCYLGGGFGRRSHRDFVAQATRIAMAVDKPVQMIWSRQEEMRAGAYRPMSAMRFKAGFDIKKQLVAVTNHSVTHSIRYDRDGEVDGVDAASVEGLYNHPYDFPAYRFSHTRLNTHFTTWWWRSVGSSINAWAMECFVDEMAHAASQDPLTYRRRLLAGNETYLNVLDVLEKETQWRRRSLPRGSAMGMAIHESFGTTVGLVAEVTVNDNGSVSVDRITAVVDCGNLVNPLTAEEQIEGGIIDGLSAALYGKLTVENGRILEDNLDTYEILRMNETPEIKIHWALSGGDKWGGLGEPATPVVAPAICNALFPITQRRIRTLPIRDYYLQAR